MSLSQAGEADAGLEIVFRAQYPRLIRLLVRITGDRGQAEELASEVFCRLSARRIMFRPGSNLEGWLYRTATNLGLDALKMESRRRRNEQAAAAEAARAANRIDPLEDVLRLEQQQRVRAVIALMKPVYAQLLLLRHAGFSYSELAEILKLRQGSVGKLLARSMAGFERKYREWYGGE